MLSDVLILNKEVSVRLFIGCKLVIICSGNCGIAVWCWEDEYIISVRYSLILFAVIKLLKIGNDLNHGLKYMFNDWNVEGNTCFWCPVWLYHYSTSTLAGVKLSRANSFTVVLIIILTDY